MAATVVAVLAIDGDISLPWAAAGALGTVAFELLATRHRAAIRGYWERSGAQAASVVAAFTVVGLGACLAPSTVLSAVLGALVAYLLILAVVAAG